MGTQACQALPSHRDTPAHPVIEEGADRGTRCRVGTWPHEADLGPAEPSEAWTAHMFSPLCLDLLHPRFPVNPSSSFSVGAREPLHGDLAKPQGRHALPAPSVHLITWLCLRTRPDLTASYHPTPATLGQAAIIMAVASSLVSPIPPLIPLLCSVTSSHRDLLKT